MSDHSPDPEETDEALMTAIASGDQQAFRRFVELHQALVIGTVARMIGVADAEDISQQVFINVWKSAPRWSPKAKVTTWLMTIAKRLVFNESRRRSRSRLLPQSREDEAAIEMMDPAPAPDSQALGIELHHAVENAMASLSEKERMVVVLRRHEGMPYEEIAKVLGSSVPAVKSLLFRARNILREKLTPYLEG